MQGRAEFPLTALGRGQAEALAERLSALRIAALYASPQTRAMETAQIVGERLGVAVNSDGRLMEYDLGPDISGMRWEDVKEKYPHIVEALTEDDSYGPRYPGEEGREEFMARVIAVFEEIIAKHSAGEAAAVVTHGGPVIAFVTHVLGRRMDRSLRLAVDNASITTVEINEPGTFGGIVLASLNDTCHLHGVEREQPPPLDLVAQTASIEEAPA
jgi:broad specificity phosphatase PhoE